ncbi:MAG: endonuclease [Muribaculaceae bacterium]|nr:endonuclease [Muribaculaceae bacterium]
MNFKHIVLAVASASASIFASTAAEPAGYYSSCENKGGRSLLSALHAKIGPHTTVGYDELYDLYKTSDVRGNGRIWDMYSTKEWPVNSQRCGNYKNIGDCYNREHSFPKSWFSEGKPMYSDAFHLYPTDGKVNGQRSNYPYGECANGTRLPDYNGVHALGRLGNSTFPGYSDKVFEPDDEYKGDFARSYFYMATAYNDRIASWSSPMLAGNAFPAFSSWAVQLLLKWHRQDPVSEKEIRRNDAVYARQKNRNPYIDHPELVEYIWGNRSSDTWTSSSSAAPAIVLPADGSTIDMGLTAKGVAISREIAVRTTGASAPVVLSFNGREFEASPSTLQPSATNTADGARSTITFEADVVGVYSETMTVSCGAVSSRVLFRIEIVDGLPLLPAANITSESFDVCWTYVGDADASGCYSLAVTDAEGRAIPGYPRAVDAKAGRYTVADLTPATEYRFSLKSKTLTSKTGEVSTAEPLPEVDFFFEGDIRLVSAPGEPSPAAEIWIETDNVDSDYTVSVSAPFQLSLDKALWSRSLTLSPEDDRMYLRVLSDEEGEFETSIVAMVGSHRIDDAEVSAIIAAPGADFLETFENFPDGMGSYANHEYEGTACSWHFEDIGMWSSDKAHTGSYAIRGGKGGAAVLEMTSDRPSGIGMLRFWAHVWNTDAAPEFDVMLSTDGGSSWSKVGSIKLDGADYKEYSCPVNAIGRARIKLVQTDGKRFLLDDLSLSSHASGLDAPTALHNQWDAWCPASGCLRVEAAAPVSISVYALDGRVLAAGRAVSPDAPLLLEGLAPAEVYIVVADDFSRRVLVR